MPVPRMDDEVPKPAKNGDRFIIPLMVAVLIAVTVLVVVYR